MILPAYQTVTESISGLKLPYSVSELHGLLCGYLVAGKTHQGELMMQSLLTKSIVDEASRAASRMLFDVITVSQQQLAHFEFDFELLLPEDDTSLIDRAHAFTEWCEGFVQGLKVAGITAEQLQEEEVQDALQHISEFAQLDYQALTLGENDERAFMEVSEYTRMAVLQIYADLKSKNNTDRSSDTAH